MSESWFIVICSPAKCCPRYVYPLTILQRRHKERLYEPAEMAYCQVGGYACASDPQVIPYIQSVLGNLFKIMFELLEIVCGQKVFGSLSRRADSSNILVLFLFSSLLIKKRISSFTRRLCETPCIYAYVICVIAMRYTGNIYRTYSHCALGISPRGERGDGGVRKSRLLG